MAKAAAVEEGHAESRLRMGRNRGWWTAALAARTVVRLRGSWGSGPSRHARRNAGIRRGSAATAAEGLHIVPRVILPPTRGRVVRHSGVGSR
jgi:hypothetical protein